MKVPARVGLVGCGVISREYAANAAAFDAFEIVACADLDRERRAALAEEHVWPRWIRTTLLADPGIDIVLNLTPPAAHHDVTRTALEQGKHVYSEKPLSMVGDRCARCSLAEATGGLQIGVRARHLPRRGLPGSARAHRRGRDRHPARSLGDDARRRPGDLASRSGHVLSRRRRPAPRHGAVLPVGDRGPPRPDRPRRRASHRRSSTNARSSSGRGQASASRPRRRRTQQP